MNKNIVVCLVVTALLSGCATWMAVTGSYSMRSQNYKVELPEGWRKYNPSRDSLIITKDGITLQQIRIERNSVDRELPHTKKKLSKEMLNQEVAEVLMDNIRSNPNIMNQRFIENAPVQIGGYPGIKLVYTYQTERGLTKKGINYCLIVGDWCYEILYEAPERYYFTKDLEAFEKVKESFRLIKKTTS